MAEETDVVAENTETAAKDQEEDIKKTNPYEKPRRPIEDMITDESIPERDRERLKELKVEIEKEDTSKSRKKKLWKEVVWVAERKKRNDQKKLERKKRKSEIRDGVRPPSEKKRKVTKMSESSCKIKVCLDMSLHDLMTDEERMKCGKQILRCYSINRRSDAPVQLHLTGLEGTQYWTSKMPGFENWDLNRVEKNHAEYFGKDNVVYLSGDSDVELTDLKENEAYIIGAMVDHNRHKGLTHQRALEAGVRHAKLPLDKYVDMKTRKVLTVDHVFEIMLMRANGVEWSQAIIKALPARKGAQLKEAESEGEEVESGDEGEDGQAEEEGSETGKPKVVEEKNEVGSGDFKEV